MNRGRREIDTEGFLRASHNAFVRTNPTCLDQLPHRGTGALGFGRIADRLPPQPAGSGIGIAQIHLLGTHEIIFQSNDTKRKPSPGSLDGYDVWGRPAGVSKHIVAVRGTR